MIAPELLCLAMVVVSSGLLMAGFPVAFTLAGSALAFALLGAALGVFPLAILAAFPQNIFATMTNDVLVAVPLFVFMGLMLERSRVAENLLDGMARLFGRLPGGLAVSVSLVGALLAASTGVVGATVVTMGLIALPTMLARGYDPRLAAGSIAASGTLGQLIPPSIVLVLLGDQLSVAYQNAQFEMGIFAPATVSVNDLFAGALFPGLMLVGLYVAYQIAVAAIRPDRAPAIPPAETAGDGAAGLLGSLFAPVLLVVAVLGSILVGVASPTEAAGVGAVAATMLAGYKLDPRRGSPIAAAGLAMAGLVVLASVVDLRMQRQAVRPAEWFAVAVAAGLTAIVAAGVAIALARTFRARSADGSRILAGVAERTMTITAMVFVIVIAASLFSLVLRGLGGDLWIEEQLADLPGGALTAMLVVMAAVFLLGFVLEFLEIVYIVVPIVAPALLQMQLADGTPISPVWLGVMLAGNLQTSFLTPPVGVAMFYLRAVAPPELRTADIYRGVVPFVALQLVALVLLWYAPGLATWLPEALYGD